MKQAKGKKKFPNNFVYQTSSIPTFLSEKFDFPFNQKHFFLLERILNNFPSQKRNQSIEKIYIF